MVDLLIAGGWVVDGSGAPPFRADIAVDGDRIVAVGRLADAKAVRVIPAAGLHVMPGFVDAHVHGDAWLLADGPAEAALRQGVTTFVLGQDGTGLAPIGPHSLPHLREYFRAVNGDPHVDYAWRTVGQYLDRLEGAAVNVACLVPNGNLRLETMGLDARAARPEEVTAMRRLLARSLDEGAVGLSTGLDYIPSRYADTEELVGLCEVVAERGGVYVSHMRHWLGAPTSYVGEVTEIARRSQVAAHISHFGGEAEVNLGLLEQGHRAGLDVTFDLYPYLAGSTLVGMTVLPAWVQEGGVSATLARLRERDVRDRLFAEWAKHGAPPFAEMRLSFIDDLEHAWMLGRSLAEVAETLGHSPWELTCDLLVSTRFGLGSVVFSPDRTEHDMRALLRSPYHLMGSDGIYYGGHPHPRGWGAFARGLGTHTRELGDWHWGEASVHMASHAARRFALGRRGLVRSAHAADLVVYDPGLVADRATYAAPMRSAVGVRYVVVNGALAVDNGEVTGIRAGRALRAGAQ